MMAEADFTGLSVLVAEDELLLALDLTDMLRSVGCVVVGPARSVAAARSHVQQGAKIDLALLDLNLDGESALSLVQDFSTAGIPVIITTGYDQPDLPEGLRQVKICVKPIAPGTLLHTMRALMPDFHKS